MTLNLSSRNFSLTINEVDRTSEFSSIDLAQPSTLERRDAPITGTITLVFNPLRYNEFITIGSPAIAANWAAGALIVFQCANDSGTLVNNLLSGGALYILKEPSPPNISFDVGTLSLEVGCILAYQSQRTADRDVSGVTIGTSTDRDEIVRRVLIDAGITFHSIPSLSYPFNTPVQKTGGSPIKLAGDLVGAVKHVLYCNASGTVIAAPIDLAASPIATLTIGQDESSFEPVDGSSIPTVTELTISGVCEEPYQGEYPVIVTNEISSELQFQGVSLQESIIVSQGYLKVFSENYSAGITRRRIGDDGKEYEPSTGGRPPALTPASISVNRIQFDQKNRLIKKTAHQYSLRFAPFSGFYETSRTEEQYLYQDDKLVKTIVSVFEGETKEDQFFVELLPKSKETIDYLSKGTVFSKSVTKEDTFNGEKEQYKTIVPQQVIFDTESYGVLGLNYSATAQGFSKKNIQTFTGEDNRPPATTYSEKVRTKNREITATVNALPLAGVPSKEKQEPIIVDWLVSDAQALEYGQLEVVLRNGRKQCRFMITALTNELLALRPRCRIDIIFNSILYRCLADSITFSQDLTRRTIGFMCDVISTSPIATPSTVYRPSTPILSLRGSIVIDAIANGSITQTFDVGSIIIDAVVSGVLAEQGQIEGEIAINANVFGILTH
jgi:hypothetical protein